MTDLLTRLEAMLTPNADGLLPCQQHSDASLSDLSIEDGHDGQTFAIDCWCGVRGPDSMTRDGAIAAWNSRPLLRALVEAVKTVPCDQDMHARHRVNECDRCALETKIIAILEGKP